MAIQHSAIPDAQLHEPKGVAGAANNTHYKANGAGSGTWQKLSNVELNGITVNATSGQFLVGDGSGGFSFADGAHGSIYFENIGAPYTLVYPATFTKLAPTTIASGSATAITEGTNARLTYTGANTLHADVVFAISMDQNAGANRAVRLALYKNGAIVPGTTIIQTSQNAVIGVGSIHSHVVLATNDYLEVYAQNDGASGDIRVYTFSLFISVAGT